MHVCAGSVESSGAVLMPSANDSDNASGSGEFDDISSFGIEPTISISEIPLTSTQVLTNTIASDIQQSSSSSMLLSTSELMTTSSSVDIQPTSSREQSEITAISIPTISTTTSSSSRVSSSITGVTSISETTQATSTVSLMPTPEPTRTTTEVLMTSSPISATTNQIATTDAPSGSPAPSVLDSKY